MQERSCAQPESSLRWRARNLMRYGHEVPHDEGIKFQ